MLSEARKRSNARYDAKSCKHFSLKLNLKTDADIIKFLDSQESKQGAVKRAIRYYLNKGAE